MINKKIYYSISEVSKILDIHEHTIRFWDSKLPDLSRRSEKGRTRFFNNQQIEKISNIRNLLKNNDSLTLAFKIVSKNRFVRDSSKNDVSKQSFTSYGISTSKIIKIKKNNKEFESIIKSQIIYIYQLFIIFI